MINQAFLIKKFNDENRENFNEMLFTRDENEIIEEVKKVILSCQKDGDYVIKVKSFEVIEDYNEIMQHMENYYNDLYNKNNKNKKKKRINTYEFINLKDTDFKLLIVNVYTRINNAKGEEQNLKIYIQIPKIVNKYYFRIAGNLYSAVYQIVDGSTYNNATSSSKVPIITLKSPFMSLKISKYIYELKTMAGETIPAVCYNASYLFAKTFNIFKYILAKYGLYDTIVYAGYEHCIYVTNYDIKSENMYTIKCGNNHDIYVNVSKYVYDNDFTIQSLVYAIYVCISKTKKDKHFNFEKIYNRNFWLESLGAEFNSSTIKKGMSMLQSFESIYDIKTVEVIKIPDKDKRNIYDITMWMMREFSALRNKENVDISTKRIRYGEYLASLYAMKLSQGIYRLSDSDKITLNTIKQSIVINPSFLIDEIVKCNLVNFRNLVNDLDSITALKFSYKVISGVSGGKNKNKTKTTVAKVFKFIHPSHFGRIDVDSSSKSDPGLTGILCPMADIYDNGYFSEFEEPYSWEENFSTVLSQYKSLIGLKESIISRKQLLGIESKKDQKILASTCQSINIFKKLMNPIQRVDKNSVYEDWTVAAEEGGYIYYE